VSIFILWHMYLSPFHWLLTGIGDFDTPIYHINIRMRFTAVN